ncbi:uncharacterized protein LOC129601730 isoform X2 [Paramacrobiotus metropolitanus]|uniref:uncharacterized protein LOC129601730 isoform X2 n=1 Tax=Paramacrobiotus metropolitanus TaxID=2943436 RepID=UPI002445A7B4|nr:uncharacterized protein LOC129601730 isoform X2 [Paramacrobiotus metropolitanus]
MNSPRRSQRVLALERGSILPLAVAVPKRRKFAVHRSPNDNLTGNGVEEESASSARSSRKRRYRSPNNAEKTSEIKQLENCERKQASRKKAVSSTFVELAPDKTENKEPRGTKTRNKFPTAVRRSTRTAQPTLKALEGFASLPPRSKRGQQRASDSMPSSSTVVAVIAPSIQLHSWTASVPSVPSCLLKKHKPSVIQHNSSASVVGSKRKRKRNAASDREHSLPAVSHTALEAYDSDLPNSSETQNMTEFTVNGVHATVAVEDAAQSNIPLTDGILSVRAKKTIKPKRIKGSAAKKTSIAKAKAVSAVSIEVGNVDLPTLSPETMDSHIQISAETDKPPAVATAAEGPPNRRKYQRSSRPSRLLVGGSASNSISHYIATKRKRQSASTRARNPQAVLIQPAGSSQDGLKSDVIPPSTAVEAEITHSSVEMDAMNMNTQTIPKQFRITTPRRRSKKSGNSVLPAHPGEGTPVETINRRKSSELDISLSQSFILPSQQLRDARSRSKLSSKSSGSRLDSVHAIFMVDTQSVSAYKRSKRKNSGVDEEVEWFCWDETSLDGTIVSPARISYRPKDHAILDTIDEIVELPVLPLAVGDADVQVQPTVEVLADVGSPPDLSRQTSTGSALEEVASPTADRFLSPVTSDFSGDSWHSAMDVFENEHPVPETTKTQRKEADPCADRGLKSSCLTPSRISPRRSPRSRISTGDTAGTSGTTPVTADVNPEILLSPGIVLENSVTTSSQAVTSTPDSQNESSSIVTQQFEFLSSLPSLSQISSPLAHSTPVPSGTGSNEIIPDNAAHAASSSSLPSTDLSPEERNNPDVPERPVTPEGSGILEVDAGAQTVCSPKRPYCLEPDLCAPIEGILQFNRSTDSLRVKLTNGDTAVVSRSKLKDNVVYQQMLIDYYSKAYASREMPVTSSDANA